MAFYFIALIITLGAVVDVFYMGSMGQDYSYSLATALVWGFVIIGLMGLVK